MTTEPSWISLIHALVAVTTAILIHRITISWHICGFDPESED